MSHDQRLFNCLHTPSLMYSAAQIHFDVYSEKDDRTAKSLAEVQEDRAVGLGGGMGKDSDTSAQGE